MQMTQVLRKTMVAVLAVCAFEVYGVSEFTGKRSPGTRDFWATGTWRDDAVPTDGATVQLAFRLAKRRESLMAQPLIVSEVRFQGDPEK